MDYAVAHAPIGMTFALRAEQFVPGSPLPEILRLSKTKDKEEAFSSFTPDDRVFIEMGGANDQLALLALASGSQVISIPGFMLGDKDDVLTLLRSSTDWTLKDEQARGNETSDELTARRNRALALVSCAALADPRLMPFRQDGWKILRTKMLYRSYRQDQEAFLIAFQQLLSRLRLNYMLEAAATTVDEPGDVKPPRKSKAVSAKEALDILLQTFSDEERSEFLAKVGITDAGLKSSIPRERLDDLYETLTERLMGSDVAVSTLVTSMKDTKKKIEQTLASMPFYERVFDPIPCVGPLIAARMIANIGDIQRFKSAAALRAYAGYHHFEDGSRARRVKGTVSNWSPELKQAVYLWCDLTLKRKDSPWRHRLDQRRAYELYKLLKQRQVEANALGMDVEILPTTFAARSITSVLDVTRADYAVYKDTGKRTKPTKRQPDGKPILKLIGGLAFHVDQLRAQAGVKNISNVDDEEAIDESEMDDEAPEVKNPALAKLLKGLKQNALDKAMRWLGQQFLKHIFKEWRKAIGLSEHPVKTKPNAPSLANETLRTEHKPVSWSDVSSTYP